MSDRKKLFEQYNNFILKNKFDNKRIKKIYKEFILKNEDDYKCIQINWLKNISRFALTILVIYILLNLKVNFLMEEDSLIFSILFLFFSFLSHLVKFSYLVELLYKIGLKEIISIDNEKIILLKNNFVNIEYKYETFSKYKQFENILVIFLFADQEYIFIDLDQLNDSDKTILYSKLKKG